MEPELTQGTAAVEPTATKPQPSFGSRAGLVVTRISLGAAGIALLAGFFMPWFTMGEVMSLSGFALAVSSGQVVSKLTGPNGALLFIVPLAALGLLFGVWRGRRTMIVAALAAGAAILLCGFYTAVHVFIDSTGAGMWLVVIASFVAIGVGLLNYDRTWRPV